MVGAHVATIHHSDPFFCRVDDDQEWTNVMNTDPAFLVGWMNQFMVWGWGRHGGGEVKSFQRVNLFMCM